MSIITLDISRDDALLLAVRLEYIVNEFRLYAAEERQWKNRSHKISRYEEYADLFRRLAISIRAQADGGESVILKDEKALWPPCLKRED